MQVDPIKATWKAPGIKRLKLQSDEPPSNFAFKFNLRRYSVALKGDAVSRSMLIMGPVSAQLDTSLMEDNGGLDVISGWDIVSASANEMSYLDVQWNQMAGTSGPMFETLQLIGKMNAAFNITFDIDKEQEASKMRCVIRMK